MFDLSKLMSPIERPLYVLEATKAVGAAYFVATSSGSVGIKPPKYFLPPWRRWPHDIFQVLYNAGPLKDLDAPLEKFGSCYAFSKAKAEKLVREADDRKNGFRTGCIRPGHAIYAHGVENVSNISWDYLHRGGSPSYVFLIFPSIFIAAYAAFGLIVLKTNPRT